MTDAPRPWASAACMAGRPDDCPRVNPNDGRQCVNPAHTAYPDDLGPGEQLTLDDPTAAYVIADTPAGDTGVPIVEKPARRRRWTCDRCGELVYRAEHVTGPRQEPVYACDTADEAEPGPIDGPMSVVDLPDDPASAPDGDPPELTSGEVKRISAAHLRLPLEPALDVVRTIIAERLTNPEGAS